MFHDSTQLRLSVIQNIVKIIQIFLIQNIYRVVHDISTIFSKNDAKMFRTLIGFQSATNRDIRNFEADLKLINFLVS